MSGGKDSQKRILTVLLTSGQVTQTAIVCATGSGKTTLINLLTRFYDVSAGSILLDGRDLRDYRMEELRQAFGVVLQLDRGLFPYALLSR